MGRRWCLSMFGALAWSWQVSHAEVLTAAPVFKVYGTEQGLPSRQVQALAQDPLGRLWIGTAFGLVRYDGQSMQSYSPRRDAPRALVSGSIEALLADHNGQIWVASEGGNLARWHAASNDFERIALTWQDNGEPMEIWALAALPGQILVGTYGAGVLQLDSAGRLTRRYGTEAGLPSLNIVDLLATPAGMLWMVTMEGDLARMDPRQGRAELVPTPDGTPNAMAIRGERLQYSTREGSLCEVDPDLNTQCAAIPELALPGSARPLLPDARGDWIGGQGELLRRRGEQWQRISWQPGSMGGVPRQRLSTALLDADQGLWLGSFGGGLLHLPAEADRFAVWQPATTAGTGLRDGRVRGLARDLKGNVWIGTMNAGVHRLDPHSGRIDALSNTPGERVFALAFQPPDRLWIGGRDGVRQMRIEANGDLTALWTWPATTLLAGNVDLLHLDKDGRVWAASMGAGINRIDSGSGAVHHYPFDRAHLLGTEAQMLDSGPDGRMWAAVDRGLYAWDAGCDCFTTLIADARVEAFATTPDGRIYVFVDGQLVAYRWRDGLFRDENLAPRVFAEFQSVGGMRWVDDALWLAGTQGLFRYVPTTDQLSTWDTRDGLATTEFSDRPYLQDASGRLWLGSEEGLVSLDPRSATASGRPARLRFDRIELDGSNGQQFLDPELPGVLDADARGISLAIRLDSLARVHAQRFSVRVEGRDLDWPPPRAQAEHTIGTLPPGSYQIQVRGWDGYGNAAANELSWRLTVRPPWWRTYWAYAAYLLLMFALMAGVDYIRRRRHRAAAVLQEAHRKTRWAEQLANEKSALVAELSHEIRNPLNGVLGMARLIGQTSLPPRAERYLGLLTDAGHQLTQLLDDVLDWSRLNAGHDDLRVESLPLAPALKPCLDRYRQQARARGLHFRVVHDDQLVVRAAPARLIQIVDNLLANALKYTVSGEVQVRMTADPDQPGRVRIAVSDTGPGLSATELDRLFRPFERLSATRNTPGTGLGLVISRSLAERMGGSLGAENRSDGGARFTLWLPQGESLPSLPEPRNAASTVPSADLHVLLVEDDPIGREWVEALLADWGARIHACGDGLSALIALEAQAFDAALIDWDLPGLSGLELARIVRQRTPRTLLVAITGRATPDDIQRGREAGFDDHLGKPIKPAELAASLAHCQRPPAIGSPQRRAASLD